MFVSVDMATFTLNLLRKIEPGLVTCGKFDGSHSCLVVATSAGNILIHSPHRQPPSTVADNWQNNVERRLQWNGDIAELSIGKQVLSLHTGRLLIDDERDILLIGTLTHVLAYQVEENADLFHKEISDGAYAITVGKLSWLPNNVTIIGSNCSVTILDAQGVEIFWTVMGDIVRSVAVIDFDGDGEMELLTGSDNHEIKVLKGDFTLWETKETAAVTALTPLSTANDRQFAYVVANGTVGVYEGSQRLWRIKSKHKVVSVKNYDVNGDGTIELLTGWSSGKLDARICSNGDVILRVQLNASIAGIIEADYRRTGRPDLIVISTAGEIRGYESGSIIAADIPASSSTSDDLIQKLITKKQSLLMELRHRDGPFQDYVGTKVAISIFAARGAVRIALASGPGLFIHCAIVFAEGVFDGETLVAHPKIPVGELEIELRPTNNIQVDIHVKICLGTFDSDLYQVVEFVRQLPQFCMYELIPHAEINSKNSSKSGVFFDIAERSQRIALWLNQCLLLTEELQVPDEGPRAGLIEFSLRSMRDNKIHSFKSNATGRTTIYTEDSSFAGDIIQSLAMYLGIQELSSEARFPTDEEHLIATLQRVKDLQQVEARLQADAAGGSSILKSLVVRLEDARILQDIEGMKRRLFQLETINGDLLREHEIRMNTTKELAVALKQLNIGVGNASRLRVGRAATNAIVRCRNAIQDENPKALIMALASG